MLGRACAPALALLLALLGCGSGTSNPADGAAADASIRDSTTTPPDGSTGLPPGPHVPGGTTRIGEQLAVPGSVHITPGGRYVIYAAMEATGEAGRHPYEVEDLRVYDVESGSERILTDALLRCNVGCNVAPIVREISSDGRFALLAGRGNLLVDLSAGSVESLDAVGGVLGFSPDSTGAAYCRATTGEQCDITYRRLVDGTETVLGTTRGLAQGRLTVTPEGVVLVLTTLRAGSPSSIEAWSTDGSFPPRVLAETSASFYIAGSRVLYSSGSPPALYSVPIAGGAAQRLAEGRPFADPVSPDGERVLMIPLPDATEGTRTARVDGSDVTMLQVPEDTAAICWQDADHVLAGGDGGLYRVPVDGGEAERISGSVRGLDCGPSTFTYVELMASEGLVWATDEERRGNLNIYTASAHQWTEAGTTLLSTSIAGGAPPVDQATGRIVLNVLAFDFGDDVRPLPENGLYLLSP